MGKMPFTVMVQSTVTIRTEVEINADDSFDNARSLGRSAIDSWLSHTFTNAERKVWPNPKCNVDKIEVLSVSGTWERGK